MSTRQPNLLYAGEPGPQLPLNTSKICPEPLRLVQKGPHIAESLQASFAQRGCQSFSWVAYSQTWSSALLSDCKLQIY